VIPAGRPLPNCNLCWSEGIPGDHRKPEFLGQSNHPFAAAAEEPFLTTVAKSRFSLVFAPLVWVARIGTGVNLDAAKDNFRFARDPLTIAKPTMRATSPVYRAASLPSCSKGIPTTLIPALIAITADFLPNLVAGSHLKLLHVNTQTSCRIDFSPSTRLRRTR
jgi:hypothetical protein